MFSKLKMRAARAPRIRPAGTLLLIAALMSAVPACAAEERVERLIQEIIRDTHETRHYTGIDQLSERVVGAMRHTPRDRFVPRSSTLWAWENRPLSIGYGQFQPAGQQPANR